MECVPSGGQKKELNVFFYPSICSLKAESLPKPTACVFLTRVEGSKPQSAFCFQLVALELGLLVAWGTSLLDECWDIMAPEQALVTVEPSL